MFGVDEPASADMVARERGVMAGGEVLADVFVALDPSAKVDIRVEDGSVFESGQTLASISTDVRSLLRGERVALNFVQRMSGIATSTRRFVDAVSRTEAKIVDTRKTAPGLRAFEKHAVRCGGGVNHRFCLSDAVLVKDNHLAHLVKRGATVASVLHDVRSRVPFTTHIEVEVDALEQIEPVLASGVVDSVLIDNFSLDDARAAVELVAGRALVNASGGLSTPELAAGMAAAGVDLLSIGAITHSAAVIDIGLDMEIG
jgi:nicotinate-nucleotide pyrophosphorylase (carboxylating)